MVSAGHDLIHGPLSRNTAHLCLDMQNLFARGAPWQTPWMERVLPCVVRIVERMPHRTIFTRFVPAKSAEGRRVKRCGSGPHDSEDAGLITDLWYKNAIVYSLSDA